MAAIADTIIVGDIIYKDIKKALKTVKIKGVARNECVIKSYEYRAK